MTPPVNDTSLRRLLTVDGAFALAAGVVTLAAASPIAGWLSVTTAAVQVTAVVMLAIAADALALAAAPAVWRRRLMGAFVVAKEAAWAAVVVEALIGGAGWAAAVSGVLLADGIILSGFEMRLARKAYGPKAAARPGAQREAALSS